MKGRTQKCWQYGTVENKTVSAPRAGVEYRGLPVRAVSDVVAAHVSEPTEEHPEFQPPPLPPGAEELQSGVDGLCLFVCASQCFCSWHKTEDIMCA